MVMPCALAIAAATSTGVAADTVTVTHWLFGPVAVLAHRCAVASTAGAISGAAATDRCRSPSHEELRFWRTTSVRNPPTTAMEVTMPRITRLVGPAEWGLRWRAVTATHLGVAIWRPPRAVRPMLQT